MPEPRARQYHRDRVAETLREEIGAMIEGELSDPRISFAYVTQVVLNPGGKSGLIYVAVDGGPEEEAQTIEGLMAARGTSGTHAARAAGTLPRLLILYLSHRSLREDEGAHRRTAGRKRNRQKDVPSSQGQ